jgi:hypothetical protein
MGDEICDVIAHGRLPAKAEASQAMRLEMAPQQRFCTRHRAPQLSGASSL